MSHRAHSKGKIWSSSMNLKGKQREEEEVDELESESETTAFESTTLIQHQHPHSERVLSLDVHPQWETISSTTSSSKVGGKKTAKAHVQDKPAAKDNPHIPFARMESILHNDRKLSNFRPCQVYSKLRVQQIVVHYQKKLSTSSCVPLCVISCLSCILPC